MIRKLLCKIGFHKWVDRKGELSGPDGEMLSVVSECQRCGLTYAYRMRKR